MKYKNLFFTTQLTNTAGLGNPSGSKRAENFYLLCKSIHKKLNAEKGITLLTGTPITNSLTELYTIFRQMREVEYLDNKGMLNFDDWRVQYAEVSTEFEGNHFVLTPITDVVKKFDRNHRTIQRRINALKDEGLLVPIIKRNTITLYQIFNTEE